MCVGILFALLNITCVAKGPEMTPQDVKSALVYRFLNFVTWPKEAFKTSSDNIIVGVITEEVFETMVRIVKKKKIGKRSVAIVHLSPEKLKSVAIIKGCHAIYFGSEKIDILEIVSGHLESAPTLLIGDRVKFLESGGMVNFLPGPSRVRYEINNKAAKACNLSIDKKILHLARRVIN